MNYNQTPIEIFGLEKVSGDIALELEVEGRGLPNIQSSLWGSHTDGSLKLGGMEYVHNGPKNKKDLLDSLNTWEEEILKSDATVYESDRTSVHTHLNVQDKTIKQILQGAVAYYMLEPALMNHCGQNRKGNLFCLTMESAPGILQYMKKYADGTVSCVNSDTYRYASLNFGAIKKFGSIEARTMRGYYDPEFLNQWALELRSLFDNAGEMKDPTAVFDSWYGRQKEEFMEQFFSKEFIDVLRSYEGWDVKLDRNHKFLSSFVYDQDWNKEFPKEEKKSVYQDFIDLWSSRPEPIRILRDRPVWTVQQVILSFDALWEAEVERLVEKVIECFNQWYDGHAITYPEDREQQIRQKIREQHTAVVIYRDQNMNTKKVWTSAGSETEEYNLKVELADHFEAAWNLVDQLPQPEESEDW